MNSKSAHVIGAGFSGMIAAYLLTERGFSVTVMDPDEQPGGMIRTLPMPGGDLETAANGFIHSEFLQSIATRIGVELVEASPVARKNRFLYIDSLSRWPLGILETLALGLRVLRGLIFRSMAPRPMETLEEWGLRTLGDPATRKILSTAILGIYATEPARLSATLVVGRFFSKSKTKLGGTVAPKAGMGEWFTALRRHLESRGVSFVRAEQAPLPSRRGVDLTVVATSAPAAARLLSETCPELSRKLASIEMVPVVTATLLTDSQPTLPRGFGCLFHPDSGRSSLGVLFSSDIFPHRFEPSIRAETWIIGGSVRPELARLPDAELLNRILEDRSAITGASEATAPRQTFIKRWPQAFPRYGIELEGTLASLPESPRDILLAGNYLGSLGLSQIALRIQKSVEEIAP